MATFNTNESPGVYSIVQDQSQFSFTASDTKVGIIGVADKGPVGVPTVIRSQKEFVDTFNPPSLDGFGGLAAFNALARTNQVIFTRVASDAAAASNATVIKPATTASLTGSKFARYSFGFDQDNNDFLLSVNGNNVTAIGFEEGTYKTDEVIPILEAFFVGEATVTEVSGNIKLTSTLTGSDSKINILSSAGATTLGFPTGLVQGDDATQAKVTTTNTNGVWTADRFASDDILPVRFNGDVNLTVELTGSLIDGIDNTVDLVAAFNSYAVNNIDSSLINVAQHNGEKIDFVSPTAGATSQVEILSTITTRVADALGLTGTENVSGEAATSASVTNTLKQGYNLTVQNTLGFKVDGVQKDVTFSTNGGQAYSYLYYNSGTATVLDGLDVVVDDWTFTYASASGTADTTNKTQTIDYGASTIEAFDNLATSINLFVDTVTATTLYNSGTVGSVALAGTGSGAITVTANTAGSSGNSIDFDTSDIIGLSDIGPKIPTDETLGFGYGSTIVNGQLDRVSIETVVQEINRQTGGVYAVEDNGKVTINSNLTGTSASVEITDGNSSLGYVSGDIDAGEDATDIFDIEAVTPGTWGDAISVTTDSEGITVFYNGVRFERWEGNTINASSNFIETVVNANSEFINIEYLGGVGEDIPNDISVTLADGDSGGLVTDTNINNIINLYKNKESYDINLFAVPGYSSTSVLTKIEELVNSRQDSIALIDPPVGYTPQEIINWHNGTAGSGNTFRLDNKFMALYYPWLRTNDRQNGIVRLVPPSTLLLELYAQNDNTVSRFSAPAGTKQGLLEKAQDLEYSPDINDRNLLYSDNRVNNVNPIIRVLGRGIVVWGQKSLQREFTALNRINVVRLTNYIRKEVERIAFDIVFQPNDPTTRNLFVSRVNAFLNQVEVDRGISGYSVTMDETLNTAETIAQGKLIGQIIFKPTIVAEQIELTFTVVGQDFEFV